jgi:hypothetical protein
MVDAWATLDDVFLRTGTAVDETTLVQAQDIIELFSGITFASTDNLSARNLRMLNRAVAYQAGWMPFHPDIFMNTDTDSDSQDGASSQPSHDNARLLAPFAKRWLARLTWAQKPLRVRGRYNQTDYSQLGDRDSAVRDDNFVWTPMP